MSAGIDHIEYRSVQTGDQEWTVFVVDERNPEWWRVIAAFSNAARAESYAEVETMMLHDDGTHYGDENCKAPAIPAPASGITPGRLTRRESVTHTRIEREETVALTEPKREAIEAVAVPAREQIAPPTAPRIAPPVTAPEQPAEATLPEPVDAATLPPLTPTQFKVFSACVAAKGKYLSSEELDRRCGKPGMGGNLPGVVKKGYLRPRELGSGRKAYDVLVYGEPRIYDPQKETLNNGNGTPSPIPSAMAPAPKPPAATPSQPLEHQEVIVEARKHAHIPLIGGKFDPVAYLQKKGLQVERDGDGYREGREKYSKSGILVLINRYRRAAELPDLILADLAA